MEILSCPVCGQTFQAPTPQLAPGVAAAFGIPAVALAEIHHGQNLHRLEAEIDRHMRTHTPQEWLPKLMAYKAAAECDHRGAIRQFRTTTEPQMKCTACGTEFGSPAREDG